MSVLPATANFKLSTLSLWTCKWKRCRWWLNQRCPGSRNASREGKAKSYKPRNDSFYKWKALYTSENRVCLGLKAEIDYKNSWDQLPPGPVHLLWWSWFQLSWPGGRLENYSMESLRRQISGFLSLPNRFSWVLVPYSTSCSVFSRTATAAWGGMF